MVKRDLMGGEIWECNPVEARKVWADEPTERHRIWTEEEIDEHMLDTPEQIAACIQAKRDKPGKL